MGRKNTRRRTRGTLGVAFLAAGAVLTPAQANAADLVDYRWTSRPLLVFAPTASDPRLVETVRRIEASGCDFLVRDMVLGLIAAEGTSTLDGRVIDTNQTQQLSSEFGIGSNSFSVVLIGKDGGEKLRIDDVPELQRIYAVIDGMPMRGREMNADPSRC